MRALILAGALLVCSGSARAEDAVKPPPPSDTKSIALLGSYVVGKTTEAEFLAANWSFGSAVHERVGFIDVVWDQSGASPVHSYSLGTCSNRTTLDSAEIADQSVRRAMSAPDPPPRWNLLLCSGAGATRVRTLQFRGGVLAKSEQP